MAAGPPGIGSPQSNFVPLETHLVSLKACKSQGCDSACAKQAFDAGTDEKFCVCNCCGDGGGMYCWRCSRSSPSNEPSSCSGGQLAGNMPLPLVRGPAQD